MTTIHHDGQRDLRIDDERANVSESTSGGDAEHATICAAIERATENRRRKTEAFAARVRAALLERQRAGSELSAP